jgi:hypothetical protein
VNLVDGVGTFMAVDWKVVGLPRWYDCMLGTMKDRALARILGITREQVRSRRIALGIEPFTVDKCIEPYRELLGVDTDAHVARLSGVSVFSVTAYRKAQGIAPRPRKTTIKAASPIPAGHPVRPYKGLLGLVPDQDIARVAKVKTQMVTELRVACGIVEGPPSVEFFDQVPIRDYTGPWLGYESLFGQMSVAKISRAVGVPYQVVQRRQDFLGVKPYQRVSKLARYSHLLGVVSNGVLGKLAGVSTSRVADYRAQNGYAARDSVDSEGVACRDSLRFHVGAPGLGSPEWGSMYSRSRSVPWHVNQHGAYCVFIQLKGLVSVLVSV